MQKKKVAVVLFCIVSVVVMSSCIRKTIGTFGSPVINSTKTAWNCLGSVFKGTRRSLKRKKHNVVEFCEVPDIELEGK